MKLNEEAKNELRTMIEEKLESVPKGVRIHIDKDVLEELLFKTVVYNKKEKKSFKLPVWSGNFLEKIDLSKVSFDNVSWYILSGLFKAEMTMFDEDIKDKFGIDNIEERDIFYGNTNARIDFTKSWECKNLGEIKLSNCDFSNTDLSFNDMSLLNIARECSFANTGLIIPIKNASPNARILDSDLANLDLSNYTIDATSLFNGNGIFNAQCSFSNTGLQITNLSKEMINNKYLFNDFKEMIDNGDLDGCYINGVYIHSLEEKKKIAEEKRKEYEKLKELRMNETIENLDQQIRTLNKKE